MHAYIHTYERLEEGREVVRGVRLVKQQTEATKEEEVLF
jgi:hypothetical protein